MGNLGKDAKNLILGNDGSDKEPVDFKTELQNALKAGLITKADGTLLITSRTNCDRFADLIARTEEKEVISAAKEDEMEFDTPEEAKEYLEEQKDKKEDKEKKERERKEKEKQSLEQQIMASQNEAKAKMKAEKNLEKQKQIERK